MMMHYLIFRRGRLAHGRAAGKRHTSCRKKKNYRTVWHLRFLASADDPSRATQTA